VDLDFLKSSSPILGTREVSLPTTIAMPAKIAGMGDDREQLTWN
jgi:hypothetical protein